MPGGGGTCWKPEPDKLPNSPAKIVQHSRLVMTPSVFYRCINPVESAYYVTHCFSIAATNMK